MKPGVLAIRTSGDIGNAEWRQECLILPVPVCFSFLLRFSNLGGRLNLEMMNDLDYSNRKTMLYMLV